MMEEGEKTLRAAGGAVLSVKLWWSKQKRGLHLFPDASFKNVGENKFFVNLFHLGFLLETSFG